MKRISKLLSVVLVLALLLPLVSAAPQSPTANLQRSGELADGVYTLQSVADGQTLNTFNMEYTAGGYAYTDSAVDEAGEHMLLKVNADGSYRIFPQSEDGKYAFHAESFGEHPRLCKSETVTALSDFDICRDGDAYAVLLHGTEKALSIGSGKTLYRKPLVTLEPYTGADTQKWVISPVEISSFELKTVAERVNVNTVSAVYALVTPAYMKEQITWSSDDESVVLMDTDGSFCALSAGTATVTATVGDMARSIEVTVVDSPSYTWYSQHLATAGGWHGGELSGVYFYAGAYKRFIIDRYNRGLDWMDTGCAIASVAMVMHNLGARYGGGYDFRFDKDGDLEADPYVVALANTGNRGLETESGTLYYNPILMNLRELTKNFTLFGKKLTYTERYSVSKKIIKEALDTHPEGVIVHMQNGSSSHYIVIASCINPDAANPRDYRFIVYDAAGQKRSEGDGVTFEESVSHETMYYRYGSMNSIITFDLAEDEA